MERQTIFLDALPGRKKPGPPQGDFAEWVRETGEHDIATVVFLAPEE